MDSRLQKGDLIVLLQNQDMKEFLLTILWILLVILSSCKKDNTGGYPPPIPASNDLSYGDSIFYLRNQASDYIVLPQQNRAGRYSGFP